MTATNETRDAARALLAAHDALQAANAQEPPADVELHTGGHEWLAWHERIYLPAYRAWSQAMDRFNELTGTTSRHPFNFRPAATAILQELSPEPKAEETHQ
jgi:hypothetical protein